MSYDVNKIIEESVKDIIDSDEDVLQEGAEGAEVELDAQGSAIVSEETDEPLITEKQFTESQDFLKAYVTEAANGKK